MVEQWIFNSVQKILAEQVKEEQLQADKTKEENTNTAENPNVKDNADVKPGKEIIESLFVEMKSEPKLENAENTENKTPASNIAQSQADLFMEAMQCIPEVPSSFPISNITSSSLNVSDASYLTTTAGGQTLIANNLLSDAGGSQLKQDHITSIANDTLSITSNDTLAGNDITRMNISSDAAEAAQLLSEIANQVPFQFQELQMRSTNANNLQIADQMILENSVKMEGVGSFDNLNSQLTSFDQNNVVNNPIDQRLSQPLLELEQTSHEHATPDQRIPNINANSFPQESPAPQPIETTLADGSKLYTITTVEDLTEDEMLKKVSLQTVDNSGNDDPMSEWFPSYLMSSSASEAMKSHLQQKLRSLG